MPNFEKIAPFLDNELVLTGFIIFLVVGLLKVILGLKIFKPIGANQTYLVIMKLLTIVFWLCLIGLIGAFGIQAYKVSQNVNSNNSSGIVIDSLIEPERIQPPANDQFYLRATRIIEGKAKNKQSRIFDITIENPIPKQVTLDTWEIKWQYFRGGLSNVIQASVVQPSTQHSLELTVDPSYVAPKEISVPFVSDIVLPAASSTSPSIHKLRLELLYQFAKPEFVHPASDWNIVFSISIRTTDGEEFALFVNQNWKD